MGKEFIILCLSAVVYLTSASKAPFITKCEWDDEKCILASTQVAIPILAEGMSELGVTKMDPLHIDNVDASSPNLQLHIKNIEVIGLKNCVAKKMRRDKANSKLFVGILCNAKMTGDYKMKGKILVLSIEGEGPMRVDLNNIYIDAEVDLEEKKGKDGVNHWNIKKWKHTFDLQGKSNLEFDNLFNGNEVLAKAGKELIAENGNAVISEVGQELIKSVIGVVVHNCKRFFHGVPLDELVLS